MIKCMTLEPDGDIMGCAGQNLGELVCKSSINTQVKRMPDLWESVRSPQRPTKEMGTG